MALNTARIGHRYPDTPSYEVGREKIREFATAIGDGSPIYRDVDAARAAGHRDVPAPPTFAIVIAQPAARQASADPEIGVDYSRVVHGEQRFEHHEPICAGDVLTARVEVTTIRPAGSNWMLTTRTELVRVPDEVVVCTATSSIIERGDD
jgi:acyl dehydratase